MRRWCVVAAGTLLLVAAPVALHLLPAADSDVQRGPAARRRRARRRTTPGPGTSRPRAPCSCPTRTGSATWARCSASAPRCAPGGRTPSTGGSTSCCSPGETDLVHEGDTTLRWDYEHLERHAQPRPGDPAAAHRRPGAAGAGRAAAARRRPRRRAPGAGPAGGRRRARPGCAWCRRPTSRASTTPTCGSTRASGVPLRVEVYADGADAPAFTSAVPGVLARTGRATTRSPSRRRPGWTSSFDDVLDIADAANQYAPVRPPDDRRRAGQGGVVGPRRRGLRPGHDPGDRHPAAGPGGRRPARPARHHARGRAVAASGRWSRSARSAWC